MTNLEKHIDLAKSVIEHDTDKLPSHNFYGIYPFANENLIGILNQFDFKDKNCLTVLGSSDQMLDMCLRGAVSITTFDINPLTEYYYYLKKAFLCSSLTFEDYMNFFCYKRNDGMDNKRMFDKNMFEKIVPYLEGNS